MNMNGKNTTRCVSKIPVIIKLTGYVLVFVWSIYHQYKSWKLKRAVRKFIPLCRHWGIQKLRE